MELTVVMIKCCIFMVFGLMVDHVLAGSSDFISVVDLTHPLNNETVYWPGNPSLVFTILNRGLTEGGYWYESNKFEIAEHGGTHIDAPAHFAQNRWRVSDIPAHRLIAFGVVVDVTEQAKVNPDYRLGVSDLQAWEKNYESIPEGAAVLMHSGWAVRYPNKTLTFNTNDPTNVSTFHFPGFHPEAIDWLVTNRNISMVGVDTPSTDFGQSKTFDVHIKLASSNLIGLENVNNLDKIPPSGATIFVGAIKLFDGSGGPTRILALVSNSGKPACSCPKCVPNGGVQQGQGHLWSMVIIFTIFLHL